jgi:hypothetical protein
MWSTFWDKPNQTYVVYIEWNQIVDHSKDLMHIHVEHVQMELG